MKQVAALVLFGAVIGWIARWGMTIPPMDIDDDLACLQCQVYSVAIGMSEDERLMFRVGLTEQEVDSLMTKWYGPTRDSLQVNYSIKGGEARVKIVPVWGVPRVQSMTEPEGE